MIRFEPTVRIAWWTHELSAILLNASMWSNKTRVTVVVHDIRDTPHDATQLHRYGFTVRLAPESGTPADCADLAAYLQKTAPSGFDVLDTTARVDVLQLLQHSEVRKLRR